MMCLRFDIARKLTAYIDGELSDSSVRRVERHLLDCLDCRAKVLSLRHGRSLAERLERTAPRRDVWADIEAALDRSEPVAVSRARPWRPSPSWVPRTTVGRAGWGVALVLVVINASVLLHKTIADQPSVSGDRVADLDRDDFQAVNIADIRDNTKPHIVAEGRVTEVGIDAEDGNLTFRLVDDQHASDSFVVCEVIQPLRFAPPPVGSRVRVYGVSRFDNQADHEWYEIHPVLGIEMLQPK
jgi:anti-sigma factor RsiW